MTKFKFGIISVIAVAVVATPLVLQHQSLGELRQENRALETQNQQLGPLSAANERLTNLLAQAQQVQSLSDQQLHELLRLRGEVGLLRKDSQDLAKLRAKRNEQAASAANPAAPGQTQMLTADSWADVGMDTPDAALQTFFWAARHNNADVVGKLIRWQKDASVPDFDGLDNIVTNFIPATLQFASEVQGLRILSRSEENEATARVQVEFAADGNQAAKTAEVQFVKEDTQWKPVLHVWSPHQGSIRGGLGIPSKPEN